MGFETGHEFNSCRERANTSIWELQTAEKLLEWSSVTRARLESGRKSPIRLTVERGLVALAKPVAVGLVVVVIRQRRMTIIFVTVGVRGQPTVDIVVRCPLSIMQAALACLAVRTGSILLESRRRARCGLRVRHTATTVASQREGESESSHDCNTLCLHG